MIAKAVLGIFLFSCAVGWAGWTVDQVGQSRCGGGSEGPKPLADITGDFNSDSHLVSTNGPIKEFLLWERRDTLIYRSVSNNIGATKATGDYAAGYFTASSKPLARIVDAEERYLATAGDSWVFDTRQGMPWINYQGLPQGSQHLFWNNHRLFSVAQRGNTLHFFRYRMGDYRVKPICSSLEGYKLGQGHSYPHVLLYKVRQKEGEYELSLYRANLFTCHVADVGTYQERFKGPIENVTWYEPLNAYLVKFDHPRMNLLWDGGPNVCDYFDIGDEKPFVLNYHHPVVGSWNRDQGMTLYYLKAKAKARILKELPFIEMRDLDVTLHSNGRQLYLSPQFVDGYRWLLRVRLPSMPESDLP